MLALCCAWAEKGSRGCNALRAWISALNLSWWSLCLFYGSAPGSVSGIKARLLVRGFAGNCAAWKGAVGGITLLCWVTTASAGPTAPSHRC